MSALVVIGWIIGYLMVGAFYARSQVIGTHRRASDQWSSPVSVRESVAIVSILRVLFWPGFMPMDAFRGPVMTWLRAPIETRKSRAEQLRADAQLWREKQRSGTSAEREMAAELARMCDEQAREVDL